MIRSILFTLALAAATAPAVAGSGFRVSLAQPTTTKMVVRDVLWSCAGAACSAPRTGTSADSIVCQSVARRLGRVTAFAAADRSFGADELERCNTAAQ